MFQNTRDVTGPRARLDSVSNSAPSELNATEEPSAFNNSTNISHRNNATSTTTDGDDKTTPTSTCPGGGKRRKRRQPQPEDCGGGGGRKKSMVMEAILGQPLSNEASMNEEPAVSPALSKPAAVLDFSACNDSDDDIAADKENAQQLRNSTPLKECEVVAGQRRRQAKLATTQKNVHFLMSPTSPVELSSFDVSTASSVLG